MVRPVCSDQGEWSDGLRAAPPNRGAGRPLDDYLRRVVEAEGRPVAFLAQNRCFLVLADPAKTQEDLPLLALREGFPSHPARVRALLTRS